MRNSLQVLFVSIVLCVDITFSQGLDISGYKIVQTTSAVTFTFPAGTIIAPGGYVIIGRNQAKTAFELFWGTTLGANVQFFNGTTVIAGNGFPVINGSENYTLQNASSLTIEGPTVSFGASAAENIRRISASGDATIEASWARSSSSTIANATPGSGMTVTNTGRLLISEFSDASAFANEFIEVFYDATPAPVGGGSVGVSPARWRFNVPTALKFTIQPTTDTLRAFKFVKPSPLLWDMAQATFSRSVTWQAIGDTINVSNFQLGGTDSLLLQIPGVTASDTTNEFSFGFQSSNDGATFYSIATQPRVLVYGSPRTIRTIKAKEVSGAHSLTGKWVVTKGVVTVANEFGGPSYLQDATAGMAVYDSSVSKNVQQGDEVVLLGLVAPYNNLFELVPCTILEKLSEGNSFDTLVLSATQINKQPQSGFEPYEGKLVRVNGITAVNSLTGTPQSTWTVTAPGTNFKYICLAADTGEVRITSLTNLANTPVPSYPFDIIGIVSQYLTTYQLLPRSYYDIISEGQGPRITSTAPYESNISTTSLRINWRTDVPGNSTVRYGLTSAYGTALTDTTSVTDHSVVITGLTPATVYHMQFSSTNITGTTNSPDVVVSTASLSSTGTINVFFNKSVKTSLARGETAIGNDNFPTRLIARIDAATTSIDAALYSLSGTVGANVATALINAKTRGIKVRVIGEKDNQTTVPWTTLKNGGIPVIDDGFDATNAGAGLMHNKFFVIDNRDSTSDSDDWVWTGSWNLTDPGSNDDMQNIIEVQDKAVANAFTMEFNEMWGSSTDTPNAAVSRFGARKYDNTPHLFVVNGTPIEVSFSPSDRTTGRIVSAINNAQYSVGFSLLTITRTDIANALVAKKNSGLRVHGVVDNRSDQGSQVDTLIARGVDTRIDVNSALLHHKYCVLDAEGPGTNGVTITGSHNWSSSAENSNNENTLLIRSDRIANLYLQEFAQRYQESGGTELVTVGVEEDESAIPLATSLDQNYPNPFNPTTAIRYQVSGVSKADLRVYDMLGREVVVLVNEEKMPGTYKATWNAEGMASGIYFYRLHVGGNVFTKKMILLR